MDFDLQERTGRRIAAEVFAISPGLVLAWTNQFQSGTSNAIPTELQTGLVLETEYYALYYLRNRFNACLDSKSCDAVFSKSYEVLAYLLASCYFESKAPDETGVQIRKNLSEFVEDRAKIYSTLKLNWLDRLFLRTPTITSQFASLVHHWVFERMGFNRKLAEVFAQEMSARVFKIQPQDLLREEEQAIE